MPGNPRSLPDRPSLRFLKLEARRRLAAGEFTSLHDAQLAIAREHGMPSWTVLKQTVLKQESGRGAEPAEPRSPALEQVRWVITRFSGAEAAGWEQPGREELSGHLTERFLELVPPARLAATLGRRASLLRGELAIVHQQPLEVRAQVSGMQIEALAEDEPPHRLAMLRVFPVGRRPGNAVFTSGPPPRQVGDVPPGARQVAGQALSELHLPGLILARASGEGTWLLAVGWADHGRGEPMRPDHRFPACSVTKLITATAVLRLVADGRAGLDDPANDHLHTVRLASGAVTIRDLLAHTGGVDSPAEILAGEVPDLASVTGPVLACGGERGTFRYSNAGYAALGQLIADVTGTSYAQAAARLVLRPLGMSRSSFPASWPGDGGVTGYGLGVADGTFLALPGRVCVLPAAGGLWTTAADLARFAVSWRSLLPDDLAREAVSPQAVRAPTSQHIGLGWHLGPRVAGHPGSIPGASALLITPLAGDGRAVVAFANRRVPMEPVVARVLRAIS